MLLLNSFVLLIVTFYQGTDGRDTSAIKADAELSSLINSLWNADKNRLVFGRDIRISYQNQCSWSKAKDVSNQPFFYTLNTNVFNRPTYKAFIALLDNYEKDPATKEYIPKNEITENYRFLEEVLKTDVMKRVHDYLKRKGKASSSVSQFKSTLYDLWFQMYYRSNVRGSSGFEHVFVGEVKTRDREVSGFHSWIQFYLEEKNRNLNYYGFLKKSNSNPYLSIVKYSWHNNIKHIGSSFVGTSPEFDFALYSLVYMMGYQRLQFPLAGIRVKITCFGMNGNRNIGTCYPDFAQ